MRRRCVLNLEADAAEMCADQYNEITVAYFQGIVLDREAVRESVGGEVISRRAANHLSKLGMDCVAQYEKVRDGHRRRAALLREIAEGKPRTFPIEAETVLRDLSHKAISPAPKLTSTQVLKIANRDPHLQEHLKAYTSVHGYASFQGFAWFVSYYNHGWGNLGTALVDDKTGTVLDILIVNPKNKGSCKKKVQNIKKEEERKEKTGRLDGTSTPQSSNLAIFLRLLLHAFFT